MRFIQLIGVIFVLLCGSLVSHAQPQSHAFESLDSLQKKEERLVVVLLHTDWCKYCQKMENYTLLDDSIVNTLNNEFYFVKLNGEEKKAITFHGRTFQFLPSGNNTGVHELAQILGTINGTLVYPSLCILNHSREILFNTSGYLKIKELNKILSAALALE